MHATAYFKLKCYGAYTIHTRTNAPNTAKHAGIFTQAMFRAEKMRTAKVMLNAPQTAKLKFQFYLNTTEGHKSQTLPQGTVSVVHVKTMGPKTPKRNKS